MEIQDIYSAFSEIRSVHKDTHYWLVRSMGGDFFHEFITRGYIAIGYNDISLNEIKFALSKGNEAHNELKSLIETKVTLGAEGNEEINPQYAATQLIKFYKDVKVGDIIVIPGRNSDLVAFAKIESEVYEEQNVGHYEAACRFIKRRKIHFLNKSSRKALNPKLQLMFNSRHIVSNADNYAEYIDNCVSDFYEKDGCTNLVLKVKEDSSLSGLNFSIVPDLIMLVKDFADENQLDIDVDDIKTKVCVQSPGDILFFATSFGGICLIGLFVLFFTGGEMSYNKDTGLNIKGGNILKAISDFLDRRRDRLFKKSMQEKMENMKIETPEDLAMIMKEQNDKRESY